MDFVDNNDFVDDNNMVDAIEASLDVPIEECQDPENCHYRHGYDGTQNICDACFHLFELEMSTFLCLTCSVEKDLEGYPYPHSQRCSDCGRGPEENQ